MERRPPEAVVGLCAGCRHGRRIETARGSRFLLCERARFDPMFPRYPSLPVVACVGFALAHQADAAPDGSQPP